MLNSNLCELEVSPLKVHLVKSYNKPSLGKRKLKQVEEAIIERLATVVDVTDSYLEAPDNMEVPKKIQTTI